MRKTILVAVAALFMLAFISSCSDDDSTNTEEPVTTARISGRITNSNGEAVANAEIYYKYEFPSPIVSQTPERHRDGALDEVILTNFWAVGLGYAIELHWTTSSEHDAASFRVNRAIENMFFETIAMVDAQNNPAGASYTWVDESVEENVVYKYMIVEEDINGDRIDLWRLRSTTEGNTATSFALYQNEPNPFEYGSTSCWFDLVTQCDVLLTVYDDSGSLLDTILFHNYFAGSYGATVSLGDRPNGLYRVRMRAQNYNSSITVLNNQYPIYSESPNATTEIDGSFTMELQVGDTIPFTEYGGVNSGSGLLNLVKITVNPGIGEADTTISIVPGDRITLDITLPE